MREMDITDILRGKSSKDCQCCAYGACECACDVTWPEQVAVEAADEIDRLRAELAEAVESRNDNATALAIKTIELAEARRLLDEARGQEPAAVFTGAYGGRWTFAMLDNDAVPHTGMAFYAAPVPAQPADDEPRLWSYAEDMSTCTLSVNGKHYEYDRVPAQPAVPDDVAKDAKTVLGMEHGQVLVLRRADTKQSAGIAALSNIGTTPYIHRLDGSKIWLGDHIHGDKFTGVFEAVAVPKVEWPDDAILSATEGRKDD